MNDWTDILAMVCFSVLVLAVAALVVVLFLILFGVIPTETIIVIEKVT